MTTALKNSHGLQTRLSDPRRTSQAARWTDGKVSEDGTAHLSRLYHPTNVLEGHNLAKGSAATDRTEKQAATQRNSQGWTHSWFWGRMEGRSFRSSGWGRERRGPCSRCQRSSQRRADCSASVGKEEADPEFQMWKKAQKMLQMFILMTSM